MHLHHRVLFLLVCIIRLGVRAESECQEDPKKAAQNYDQANANYKAYLSSKVQNYTESIQEHLDKMQTNKKCISKYYSTYTANEFTLLGVNVCGIVLVLHNFQGPWKTNPNATSKEICDFLEVKGAIGLNFMNNNYYLFSKCRVDKWFKRIFYESWKKSNNCSDVY